MLLSLEGVTEENPPAYRPGREFGVRNFKYEIIFLSFFLFLVFFQMIPLPAGITKVLSPKAYEIRHALANTIPQSAIGNLQFQISFVPFITKIEFYKWLTLIAIFLVFLHWKYFGDEFRIMNQFIFLFLKAVSRLRSMSITDSRRYFGIGGLVGILALIFHSIVERNLQVPANAFLFTFLWALVVRTASFRQSERAIAGEIR